MARVCGCRIIFYSFLTVALFLSGFTLTASDIHARNSSDRSDEPRTERVQQLLSDQKIEDSEAIKLIFKEDDNALPTLLRALKEGKNVERASWALSYLGGAKERKVLRG